MKSLQDIGEEEPFDLPIGDWQSEMVKKMAHIHQHTSEKIRSEIMGRNFIHTEM